MYSKKEFFLANFYGTLPQKFKDVGVVISYSPVKEAHKYLDCSYFVAKQRIELYQAWTDVISFYFQNQDVIDEELVARFDAKRIAIVIQNMMCSSAEIALKLGISDSSVRYFVGTMFGCDYENPVTKVFCSKMKRIVFGRLRWVKTGKNCS